MHPPKIEIGARFARLVVVGSTKGGSENRTLAVCRCDCGTERIARIHDLKRGVAKSCGCLNRSGIQQTKHGHSRRNTTGNTGTYESWAAMLTRCRNRNREDAKNYIGRGITVCERWLTFENFLADMGERPAGRTLDRWPDNNKGYEPGNCRWATRREQRRNSRALVLSADKAAEIKHLLRYGVRPADIARRLGVKSRNAIYYVAQGRTWADVPVKETKR